MASLRLKRHNSLFKIITLCIILLLSACQTPTKAPLRQSEEFFIHDKDHILLNATAWTIYTYSENLYKDSKAKAYVDQGISGAEVVVVTHLGDMSDFNSTELFNAWGIGENNMGLLLVLYFDKGIEEGEYLYKETVYEFGLGMMNYFSAFKMATLVDTYFNNPTHFEWDYDGRLISLYFAILEEIYLNIYDYDSFNYQSFIDEYEINKYEYFGPISTRFSSDPLPTWAWILIVVAALMLLGILPTSFLPFLFFGGASSRSRGDGKSGGYWFKK